MKFRAVLLSGCLFTCILLAIVFNVLYGHDTIYTHGFYVPILLTGIWYPRRVILLALLLAGVHIAADYWFLESFRIQPFMRAGFMVGAALIVYYLSVHRNLLKQQVQHMNRLWIMNELVATLAHEIGQPLAAILNNAQAAQRLLANNKTPDLS